MGVRNPVVDAQIASAAPFAKPILEHLRDVAHKALPDAVEEIKWGFPTLLVDGKIVCGMGAFKAHCAFRIAGSEIKEKVRAMGYDPDGSAGALGKITSLKDLPSERALVALIKEAAKAQLAAKAAGPKKRATPKPELPVPKALSAALAKNKTAAKNFAAFAPSCRSEYSEWIGEAKREETRAKRVAEAIGWIAEGKKRNWRYEKC
ncbi:YdeI/OmpD-associated family protein [Terriglobus saanensis]|uniref:YdhG-like domain-containing protein n=1 Tax=Terriglobus saanensis (strain ATCC BAA-1853 / DSM 23119 / SP1PR4) TaxID=401053 RepID=E8V228_TERSS|nr:YdeI/OmpD-associated family protein [Terriglobus saanensis]ADV84585.1 Domain of unknown function DUF1801 [Terriglobus saanensis SP1PR4]